jgi:ABC-type antimicrobial peptide transport system permease subunit
MFRNYLTIAFRNILRQRSSTLLNISGLTLGIAASIVLFLLLQHLNSYDKFQSNYHRIYRVVNSSDGNDGNKNYTPGVPSTLPPAFRLDFPEAEEVTFTQYHSGALIVIPQPVGESKKFSEEGGVVFVEPNFFKIFNHDVLIGDAPRSLDEPNEAVISLSLAKKYFDREDVIGEVVTLGEREFKIGAVIADPPNNTDLPFTLMLSYETVRKETEEHGWGSIWSDEQCYFLLKENESISKIESRMADFTKKHLGNENFNNSIFHIQPFSDLHYDERYNTYSYSSVSRGVLLALGLIAVFLILTACINFINLATAEAIKRSREVGIRKALGSARIQLITQFLGETTLITTLAVLLSICLAQVALSFLNPFLELELSMNFGSNLGLLSFLICTLLGVSLLSGIYPALVLSGFKPALALKNQINNRNSSGFVLRKGLVVVQFFISQFFIIGTIVLISQTNYFRNKELGFRKDAILNIPIPEQEIPSDSVAVSKMRTLKNRVDNLAGIELTSLCYTPPASGNVSGTGFIMEGEGDEKMKRTQLKPADSNFISLYDLKLIAGTNLDDRDTVNAFVVNRKLAEVAGFNDPKDIIGKRIRVWGSMMPVIGVVENFHTTSLRNQIESTVLMNRLSNYHTLSIKVNPLAVQTVIPQIEKLWEATYPDHIFEYEFLDESIREFYRGEERFSILLTVFTSLAIFIGCLGLFGLATFMANQKTKEIGVRKVMGASVESIVFMFSKEFFKLILVGFALAAPCAWFMMNEWLSEFAYRIDLSAWIFLTGVGVTLLIAMVTVGYRSMRAATANPVKSLRYE